VVDHQLLEAAPGILPPFFLTGLVGQAELLPEMGRPLPILLVVTGHGQFEHLAVGPVHQVQFVGGRGNDLLTLEVGQFVAAPVQLLLGRIVVDEVLGGLDLLQGEIERLLLHELGGLFEELGKGLASHLTALRSQPVGGSLVPGVQGVDGPLVVEGRIPILEIEPELIGLVLMLLRAIPEKSFEEFHVTVRSNPRVQETVEAGPTEGSFAV
jgi:hypothetical protein